MIKGQAERLIPLIEELLSVAGHIWKDLTTIGVGTGPGNFTGVRISVAAARGLALALNIPAIGVSGPDAFAFGLPRPCRIVIPGKHGTVIWQDFESSGSAPDHPQQSPSDALPPGPDVALPRVSIAEGIARIAYEWATRPPYPRPAPIYLRPADAAPSQERGPIILP